MTRLITVALLVTNSVAQHPLEYFYTADTVTSSYSLGGGCMLDGWEGVDAEGLTGHPWVTHIKCEDGGYKLGGVNYGGPVQIWVERGSLLVGEQELDMIGSSAWLNTGAEVSLEVREQSSVWVVGAELHMREGAPPHFVNFGNGITPPAVRHYHALDFLAGLAENVQDTHINNGTADARNLVWLSKTRVDPSSILVMNCMADSWVDYHIHAGGALYLSFSGNICFHTDKKRCITEGEARWTSPNLFYYETFSSLDEPNPGSLELSTIMGMDCESPILFAVTNFDPSSPMGVPIFIDQPCVMPDGPDNRWGYCDKVVTWTTRYTPKIVTFTP